MTKTPAWLARLHSATVDAPAKELDEDAMRIRNSLATYGYSILSSTANPDSYLVANSSGYRLAVIAFLRRHIRTQRSSETARFLATNERNFDSVVHAALGHYSNSSSQITLFTFGVSKVRGQVKVSVLAKMSRNVLTHLVDTLED